MRRLGLVSIVALILSAVPIATAGRPAIAGTATVGPDYNGDGHADLAVGVPGETIDGVDEAGAVQVIYGTADGLDGDFPIDDQLWHQDSPGFGASPEPFDNFGRSLAAGDFDGDGYHDLAIGVPREDVQTSSGNFEDAGVVYVLYGSPSGLTVSGQQAFTQNAPGILGSVEAGDAFGESLESGNFGRGRFDDLAIGVPLDDIGNVRDGGQVNVIYGSVDGLTSAGNQIWAQNTSGVLDASEPGDRFGSALASANLGERGPADLAIGVPYENLGSAGDAGAVNVIYGSRAGLTANNDDFWHQDSFNVQGAAEATDRFGFSLAAAELGNGSYADLAIGAPFEDAGGVSNVGSVNVLYGADQGLTVTGNRLWYQGTSGIEGDPEDGDKFGYSLAAADFGKDAFSDLAIGVPDEDQEDAFPDDDDTGAVNVIYGTASGLNAAGDQFWWQDSSGIEGETEKFDSFGQALAVGDYGRDSHADLAVGVPGEVEEDFSLAIGDGAVNVIYGTDAGLSATGDQFWWQNSDSLGGSSEDLDFFGSALAD